MLYLTDGQPAFCPKCGKPVDPLLHGWEADQVLAAVEGDELPYSTLLPFENN